MAVEANVVAIIQAITMLLAFVAWAVLAWRLQRELLTAHRELLGMLGTLKLAQAGLSGAQSFPPQPPTGSVAGQAGHYGRTQDIDLGLQETVG
jgi:uncharacterized membrane protein